MKNLKKITLITVVLFTVVVSYFNILSMINSNDCREMAENKCPDGIKSYVHISSVYKEDVCECECL